MVPRTIPPHFGLIAFYRLVLRADAGETMQNVNPLFLHLMVLGAGEFFASPEPLIRELVPANTAMDKLAVGRDGQGATLATAARMAKSVDAADLKSAGRKVIPVRVRVRAPVARRLV